ncbi:phosphorylase family protein [Variovorax boronicumulans]
MTKILIVDDNPAKYAAIVALIEGKYLSPGNVTVASNIRDALRQLQQSKYDVLVLDMFLPESPWGEAIADGGSQLLEHIDEDEDLKKPKYIIGITASTDSEDAGGLAFVRRPWVLVRTGAGAAWEERLVSLIQHAIECESAEDAIAYGVDVCMLTALKDPEYTSLIRALAVMREPTLVDSLMSVQEGTLVSKGRDLSVVATTARKMGSTESALVAFKLISRYRPRLIAMTGICAGFEEKVQIGDVIVASPCWDYMMSSRITADSDGKRTMSYAPDHIEVSAELIGRFEHLASDAEFLARVHGDWPGDKPRMAPQIHIAPSATGPAVVADAGIFKTLRKEQHRNAIGLEMEAHGMYAAARMATRPRPLFFSAKAVCDFANFLKEDRYQKYAAYVSASVTREFLGRYGAEVCDAA